METRGKFMGRPVKRREDKRLLLGRGRYVADFKMPGMLAMAVLRSPHAHARILRLDVSALKKDPAIRLVLTGEELRGKVNPLPCFDTLPESKPVHHTVLADGKVLYVGHAVAIVVAEDRYSAEDALERIVVEYEVLPPVLDLDKAILPDSPLLYENCGTNVVHRVPQNVGDVEAAFASADRVWKETFRIHRCAGNPMETRGVLADCDPVSRQITLYSSTQHAHLTKLYLAGVLGVSDSTIRVVAPDIGGGFGVKEAFYCEEALAPIASLRLGRPVQWIEDRREHLTGAYQAREQVHHVEIAASKDGVILGAKMRGYTAIGAAYATIGNTPGAIASAMMLGPYRIPNFRSEQFNVVTNKPPLNVYRGAGHPQAVLCMERMMDIAAQDLGLDPAEIRRRNFIQPDQFPLDRQMGFVGNDRVIYDSGDYPRCLELALEAAHYNDFPQRQAEARKAGRYLGLGLSFFVEVTAVGPYETATIRVDGAGKVTLLTGIQPIGQGIVTAITQLVAEELGVEMEDVTVVFGDTSLIPDAVGTFASRGGAIGGAAARLAAVKIKDKARRIAGHLLEVGEDDLEWSGSRVQVKGAPTKGFTLAELSQKATAWNPVSALPEGMDFNLECTHHYQVSKSAYANACHVAVVDVDVETGRVKVVDYTVAHDCGRVINPMIVEGQVIGGVAQGLGGTIHEEMVFDAQGRPTSTSWMDYLLPVASDIPFINIVHQETPAPDNPYGMKGAGEGGTTGAPAALVNAIQNALEPFGVRINDDGPFSPANILKRLSLAKEKAA